MPKVILVNPSISTVGYSFFTPRWLFVIAQATPVHLVGDPLLVDESLERFRVDTVRAGDIVGIGISSGNCIPGYRVLREAKSRGATVIVGGIHATIFPDEPLEMGADAVLTGNGDLVWGKAIQDALEGNLQRLYVGGRVAGSAMLKARWDLIDPARYLFPTVQTVAGCPENCSFCSVWVTDGRQPRQRLTDKIVEEVNELYNLGFRYVAFADDNFNPSTLGRIAREPSPSKRKELTEIREARLRFFDEYDRSVPKEMFALTQMTAEIVDDEKYLSGMHDQMRIRAALIGVESFSEAGLESANKQWNPVGQEMIKTIATIQDRGILVLTSIICGLESDTVQSLHTMREFAKQSGALLAQFTFYAPYPGTKDLYGMIKDRKNAGKPNFVAQHKSQLLYERYWLDPRRPPVVIKHPKMSAGELVAENTKCWEGFYCVTEVIRRIRSTTARSWSLAAKMTYLVACLAFKRVYAGHGLSADSVNRKKTGMMTKLVIRTGIAVYTYLFRQRSVGLRVSLRRSG